MTDTPTSKIPLPASIPLGHNLYWPFWPGPQFLYYISPIYLQYMEPAGLETCQTLLVPRGVLGVACIRQSGPSAARRTGAGSAGQIQCAGQKVDKLKSSPSFVILPKLIFRAALFELNTTILRSLHLFSGHTPWLTLQPEEHPQVILKTTAGPTKRCSRARSSMGI